MKTVLKTIAAISLMALSVAPSFADELSPVGEWHSKDGTSHYEVSYCGDGTQLCAKLTWLSASAIAEANSDLVDTYVVEGAVLTDANTWSGTVVYDGKTYEGTVTLVSNGSMKLKGCARLLCKNFELERA